MSDLKLNQIPDASLPLQGDEYLLVDQAGLSRKIQIDDLPVGGGAVDSVNGQTGVVELDHTDVGALKLEDYIVIPQPILLKKRDPFIGNENIAVQWFGANTNFLQHNPKYYLFRFSGHLYNTTVLRNTKKYKHPVHLQGIGRNGTNWGGGIDCNFDGSVLPPRITEWEVPPTQYEITQLYLNDFEWFNRIPTEVDPVIIEEAGKMPRGSFHKKTRNVYFHIRIGIDDPSQTVPSTPLFGPASATFSLGPNRGGWSLNPTGTFNELVWRILG